MRSVKLLLMGAVLAVASSVSMADGGGCLAGRYAYFSDEGQLVGEATVGCNPNSSWGAQTDNAVFYAGCGVSM